MGFFGRERSKVRGRESIDHLYELDHDFMAEDGETAFTPAVRYYVDECTKDKLVLRRIEVNVDGPNLLENEVTFKKMGLYTK